MKISLNVFKFSCITIVVCSGVKLAHKHWIPHSPHKAIMLQIKPLQYLHCDVFVCFFLPFRFQKLRRFQIIVQMRFSLHMLHPFKLHICGVKIHANMCLYVHTLEPRSKRRKSEEFDESTVKLQCLTR